MICFSGLNKSKSFGKVYVGSPMIADQKLKNRVRLLG
jgi:hypothetical protein